MTVAEAMQKMILLSDANFHDINHFLKVHAYALTIGACEGLSQAQRYTLELAAIVHDIACPLCREKYGSTNGKYQEQEGAPLTRAFFEGTDVPSDTVERVVWLVAHHHTLRPIDGIDHQILVEADYLVNAEESGLAEANIRHMGETIFKTGTGKQLLQSLYLSHYRAKSPTCLLYRSGICSHLSASFQRAQQRHFVGVFQLTADWNAVGKARHLHADGS